MADTTLINEVRQLLDQTTGDVYWVPQQIYDAANEVLIDLWASGKVQVTSAPLVVNAGDDIVPYDVGHIMIPQFITLDAPGASAGSQPLFESAMPEVSVFEGQVFTTNTGTVNLNQVYWITDRAKLEQWSRFWRLDSPTQPRWFVLWDQFNLRVFPSPDATYAFHIWGTPYPAEITSTTEDLIINGNSADRMFKLAIAYRTAANLLEYTRPDLADEMIKHSEDILNRFRMRIRNINRHNIRRLKPLVGSRMTDKVGAATKGVISIGRKLT